MTNREILITEDYTRPWALMRLLPKCQRYTVARFFNRQDADNHLRFLDRYMPEAKFEVLFDLPVNQDSNQLL